MSAGAGRGAQGGDDDVGEEAFYRDAVAGGAADGASGRADECGESKGGAMSPGKLVWCEVRKKRAEAVQERLDFVLSMGDHRCEEGTPEWREQASSSHAPRPGTTFPTLATLRSGDGLGA